MTTQSPFNSLLVPTDFSDASWDAFEWASRCIDGKESVIIVLHVLDEALIDTIATHDFGSREEVATRMRQRAEERLGDYKNTENTSTEIDAIVCEGLPFLESFARRTISRSMRS